MTGVVCVIVKDANNLPVSGVSVTWGSVTNSGSVTGATQSTDANGIATLGGWTLGSVAGINMVTAASAGLPSAIFSATGVSGPATQIIAAAGNNQIATAGTALTGAVSAVVEDINNNPVAGVSVTWGNATAGGSITGTTQTTGADGIATLGGWTLGTQAGANTVTASAPSIPAIAFTATGIAGPATQLLLATGDNQTATAGTPVSGALCVIAKDANNNPVSGVSVTWDSLTGGGSLSGATQSTGANGIATLGGWTLGAAAGTNTVTAASSQAGLPTVLFTATGTTGPTQMAVAAGNNQSAPAGTSVRGVVCVIVTDANNKPVAGVSVTWGSLSGGGSVTGADQITAGNGIATLGGWILGTSAGTNTVIAASQGLPPVTFTAQAVNGLPPQFASPPQTPPPVVAGQPMTFSALETSSVPSVTWDFGDGSGAVGSTVSHVYAAPGLYKVQVTLSDGVNSTVDSVEAAVNAAVPDLSGGSGKVPNAFAVKTGALEFAFAQTGRDRIQLSGTLPVSKSFSPSGKKISMAIGGVEVGSLLNDKGISADKSFTLKGKLINGTFSDTPARFSFSLKNSALFDMLKMFGFTNANVKHPGIQIPVPIIVSIDGTAFLATATFTYTSRAKKRGGGRIGR